VFNIVTDNLNSWWASGKYVCARTTGATTQR